mgnify:CR=1 FL=1
MKEDRLPPRIPTRPTGSLSDDMREHPGLGLWLLGLLSPFALLVGWSLWDKVQRYGWPWEAWF